MRRISLPDAEGVPFDRSPHRFDGEDATPLSGSSSAREGVGTRRRSRSPPALEVTSTELRFEAKVEGSTQSLALPDEEAELRRALELQRDRKKRCEVSWTGKVRCEGDSTEDIVDATATMNYAVRQMMHEFDAIGELENETRRHRALHRNGNEHNGATLERDQTSLRLAQRFHESVVRALANVESSSAPSLDLPGTPSSTAQRRPRSGTAALVADFSSAERLLDQGVEGYVKAVRRLLKTPGEMVDDSVRVVFRNLTFTARQPVLGNIEKRYPTIGTTLYDAFIAPFACVGKTLRNVVSGAPPIEYRERPVLRNMSGLIEPGRLTLVLGPPGCGKTTFLKALSGKLYQVGNPHAELTGDLKFNGNDVSNLKNPASWVSYVPQSDEHMPLLTTRETLEFAFRCRKAPRYEDDFLLDRVRRNGGGEVSVARIKALAQIEVDVALAVLGLTNCAETVIGNENLKGVSGGEKRRVTMGEMLVTGAQIMCCDEISTGLDSAATYDITNFLRSTAHVLGQCIVVALLQPAPEVMALFDDVLVMAEGQIIYHGPRDKVQSYFESLGFRVPPNKDLGDFLVELPTRNGIDFQLSPEELRATNLPPPPCTPEEFAQRWKMSELFSRESVEIDRACSTSSREGTMNYDEVPQNGFFRQLWIVMRWSMLLRLRAKEQILARLGANALVGFFVGTLFFDLQLDDWWLVGMLLVVALMFLISTAFPNVQVTSLQKPIFFKHIEASFYSPLVFGVAQFVVAIPFVAFDVLFFITTMYWMCGLARHAEQFLLFLLICTLFGIASSTIMGLFPFITPDQDTAIVVAALCLILMIVASGAVSTESMIPEVFRWMYWLNPLAYAYRALAINEYELSGDYEMKPCKFEIVGIKLTIPQVCSDYFLSIREIRRDTKWVWIALVVQIVAALLSLGVTILAVKYVRFDVKRIGAVSSSSGGGKALPVKKAGGIWGGGRGEANYARRGAVSYPSSTMTTRDKHRGGGGGGGDDGEARASLLAGHHHDVDEEHQMGGTREEIEMNGEERRLVSDPTQDEIRQYERDLYLESVSPRTVQALQMSGSQGSRPRSGGAGQGTAFQLASPALPFRATTAASGVVTPEKTMVVRDLWYTIPINGEPVDFLKGVSFWALPGRMTALMGSSGAGKTMLMDVVAGRKTVGWARGSIMVNGMPKIQSEFTKYTGYMEQFGIHAHAATVEESLAFSAALRLPPTITATQRANFVKETLRLLELDDIKEALAGTLSMEQNKRLTLGVELIANPSIVFCDEPTSGLDARAAAIVMRVLLKVARSGRTVVCTIHQPSTAVFSFFDDLLLLKRGGEVVFFGELGEGSRNLINHLEAIPGTKKFIPGTNPATYMLDVIGAGTGADARAEAARPKIDYARAYITSPLKRANDARLASDFPPVPPEVDDDPVKAASRPSKEPTHVRSFTFQLFELLKRNWKTYYRSPEFSLNRIGVIMIFTALFAGFFWDSKMETVGDVVGRIVLIFFFSSLSALYSLYTLVPFAMARRALYYRERASNTYSVAAYTWAEGLVEIPYIIVQIVLTVPVLYWVTNLPTDDLYRPAYFMLMIFMLLLLMTSLAFFMASLFSDPLAAQLASIGVLLTLMIFCGVMVPKEDLPKPYIPMYYFSCFKYSSEGLMTSQFHELDDTICVPAGIHARGFIGRFSICTSDGSSSLSKITGISLNAADFVLGDFVKDYKWDHRWIDIGVLGAWIVALRILSYVITLFVNHQRR